MPLIARRSFPARRPAMHGANRKFACWVRRTIAPATAG